MPSGAASSGSGGASAAVAREGRDREHEQAVWARQQRRDAYAEFSSAFHRDYDTVVAMNVAGDEPDFEFFSSLYNTLSRVKVFGSVEADAIAEEMFENLMSYSGTSAEMPTRRVQESLDRFIRQARDDLGVPD